MAGLFETVAEIAAQHTVPRVRIDEIAPAVENEPEEGAVEGVPVRTTSA
jgi:hypothetical protein